MATVLSALGPHLQIHSGVFIVHGARVIKGDFEEDANQRDEQRAGLEAGGGVSGWL